MSTYLFFTESTYGTPGILLGVLLEILLRNFVTQFPPLTYYGV